ncbi:hypothetical protein ACRAKJ_33630 [Saccharothrix sp. DSM 118769]
MRFAREGYDVALVARRRGPLEALRDGLRAEGVDVEAFTADLADLVWDLVTKRDRVEEVHPPVGS